MVRTCSAGFWPWRLLHRRRPLQTCQPSAGQRSFRAGKLDSPECQTEPFGFPGGSNSTWSPTGQRAPNEPPVDQLEGSQEKIGSRSKSSANGKVKPNAEKNLEEVAAEQSKFPRAKTRNRTEAGTSSWQSQNWTVRFPKLDHPVSIASG
jgi:hypothetical protein